MWDACEWRGTNGAAADDAVLLAQRFAPLFVSHDARHFDPLRQHLGHLGLLHGGQVVGRRQVAFVLGDVVDGRALGNEECSVDVQGERMVDCIVLNGEGKVDVCVRRKDQRLVLL